MTKFIGTEYVIGNAFTYLTKERFISLGAINQYRIQLQKYWNINDVDALISGEIIDALHDYDDYFSFDYSTKLIFLKSNISVDSLKSRFVYYLPVEVAEYFETIAKNMVHV